MPIYEYHCQSCGAKNEALQKMGAGAEGLVCRNCGSKELQKIISTHCVGKHSPDPAPSCGSGGCCGGACGF